MLGIDPPRILETGVTGPGAHTLTADPRRHEVPVFLPRTHEGLAWLDSEDESIPWRNAGRGGPSLLDRRFRSSPRDPLWDVLRQRQEGPTRRPRRGSARTLPMLRLFTRPSVREPVV